MAVLQTTLPTPFDPDETVRLGFSIPDLDAGEALSTVGTVTAKRVSGGSLVDATVGADGVNIRSAGRDASGDDVGFWLDPGSEPGKYHTFWPVTTDQGQTLLVRCILTVDGNVLDAE